ncbi:MAG: acetate kinase [bacterium]|nr:acetate kinase [bacterium]
MKVLSVNAGSSSLKFQLYEMPEAKVLISGVFERIGIADGIYTIKQEGKKDEYKADLPNHTVAVDILLKTLIERKVINSLDEIKGVGHRLVHGGDKYNKSVIIDDDVMKQLNDLIPLAPLHNPANIMGVEAFKKAIPNALEVGCFDTAFHQTLEEDRYIYPVPYEWYTKYGIRKYGFHGLSHKYVSERAAQLLCTKYCRVIVCHIGSGGSISAVKNGKCIDTSMGFTPNAGIVMGSRCGDIDFSMLPYIMKETGMSLEEVDKTLSKKSGMLGISGISSDFRDIENQISNGNHKAILAHYLLVNSIVKYIAQYYVELGGCDMLCFTAGVGENSAHVRRMVVERLKALGFRIDREKNDATRFGKEGLISASNSTVPIYVIPTDEEVMIAKDTYAFLTNAD